MVGAGKRNHLVSLQRNQATRSASGALGAQAWQEFGTEWVSIDGLRGAEALQAQALRAQTIFVIKMLYRDDIQAHDRIVEGSTVYNIKTILPNSQRSELTITAETGLNG